MSLTQGHRDTEWLEKRDASRHAVLFSLPLWPRVDAESLL
jgi:hypothetical protein